MIIPIHDVDIRFVPGPWPVPQAFRDQVPVAWARLHAANPNLWDGRILGVSHPEGGPPRVENGVLRGEAREDAYSAFLTWRDQGFPEIGVRNTFGSSIIIASDGAMLLGKMAGWTAGAGLLYPPAGSLEPKDVVDGQVRVFESQRRELHEETGLEAAEARPGRVLAIFEGAMISVAVALYFAESTEALSRRIRTNLEAQSHRELEDVVAVRTRADLDAAGRYPAYVGEIVDAFAEGRFEP